MGDPTTSTGETSDRLETAIRAAAQTLMLRIRGVDSGPVGTHTTGMQITEITASITTSDEGDWNWADAGRDAWLAAAAEAGLTIQAETWDGVSAEYGCTRVLVDGTWYEIELRGDEARAIVIDIEMGQETTSS